MITTETSWFSKDRKISLFLTEKKNPRTILSPLLFPNYHFFITMARLLVGKPFRGCIAIGEIKNAPG